MTDVVAYIRQVCMSFPEVEERLSHGTPTWFVRGKKSFTYCWPNGHHQDEFAHLWCAAPPGAAQQRIADDPATYFYPAYVGHRGWVGVRLDGTDRGVLDEVLEDAYRAVAPKTLIATLDAAPSAD